MQAALLRVAALTCSCLLAVPFSTYGQPISDPGANAAAPALRRAVASAVAVAFSPSFEYQASARNQTASPPSSPAAPSLKDLGLSQSQIEGNAKEQRLLNKRSHMLQIHQRLGLITAASMFAALIASSGAGGRHVHTTTTGTDVHAALGAVTAGLYFTTAYYAIFAPKVPGTKVRGPIRLHRDLAWVHGPGMILTAILGVMAYEQRSRGEKVHGIAAAHSTVAWVTAGAFGAAIASISFKW
ncbi:MAG: hypothetical protein ACRD19_07205 [Terriglobia bacterium]